MNLVFWSVVLTTMILEASSSLIPKQQSIAIIGGGIAGLSCANRLLALDPSLDVTVFDTGKYAVGGRCSSRNRNDQKYSILSKSTYDHAAQILAVPSTASNPMLTSFAQQLSHWQNEKLLTEYINGSICSIDTRGNITPKKMKAYYGSNGMGSIPLYMSQSIPNIRQNVWVSPSNGVRRKNSQWLLQSNGKQCGSFDRLVIAHNGKCADRLMSQTPATMLHRLLQVNFAPNVPDHGGNRMTLNSIYSLTFALSAPSPLSSRLPEPFICGDILSEPNVRFVTCQTRKYPRNDNVEVWTVLSSAAFAKKFKAPQESLPDDVVETVTTKLLASLQQTLAMPAMIQPLESRLQLWGAALPINVWKNDKGFLYDLENDVGVCGDWLVEPSIAGAWTSGQLLAEHMIMKSAALTAGLEGKFVKNAGAQQNGLAAFPSTATASSQIALKR